MIKTHVDDILISGKLVTLEKGDTSNLLIDLKKKLMLLGDLRESDDVDNQFNKKLEVALSQFQARHGLDTHNQIDRTTLNALNVPLTAWVDDDGLLNFREDVYNLNSPQIAALEKLDFSFPMVKK